MKAISLNSLQVNKEVAMCFRQAIILADDGSSNVRIK